jgi:hypothetical protein
MVEIRRRSPEMTQELIEEIVNMSSGVFLWVALVTKSLLKGLTNFDNISDLRRRLREFPPELDDLFNRMLHDIQPTFYFEQASRLFQAVYHSESPLSTIELSLADDEDSELAMKAKIRSLSHNELYRRNREIANRLKTRRAGLLEVHPELPAQM